jgi:hypothetical protein
MYDEIGYLLESERDRYCFDCASLVERALKIIDRLEGELKRPQPPERKEHELALEWLSAVCGGPDAVTALDTLPLSEDGLDLPVLESESDRQRLEAVAELLDAAAERFFDAELGLAFRGALLRLWELEPLVVLGMRSATQVAAGVCHAVAAANGIVGTKGAVKQSELRTFFAVSQSPSIYAGPVTQTLRGFWPWHDITRPWMWQRRLPELLALGYADLLTTRVRSQLVRVRDQAAAAAAADAA